MVQKQEWCGSSKLMGTQHKRKLMQCITPVGVSFMIFGVNSEKE